MKKKFVIAIIVFMTFIYGNCSGCNSSSLRYHQGYIYTQEGQPIPDLKIIPYRPEGRPSAFTDENGFFIFEKEEEILSMMLYIEFEGNIIDSIQTMSKNALGYSYFFVNGAEDTVFIDIKGEKKHFYKCYPNDRKIYR